MLTPDNYDAYKGRQRRDDDARKQFQTVAQLEDDGTPRTDALLSEQVADLTGNKPAPEEVVRDNREAFCKVVDDAEMDALRTSAPKLFDYLSNPKNPPVAREHYPSLVAIEQAANKAIDASRRPIGGAFWPGLQLASASIPAVSAPIGDAEVSPPILAANSGKPVPVPLPRPMEAPTAAANPPVGAGVTDSIPAETPENADVPNAGAPAVSGPVASPSAPQNNAGVPTAAVPGAAPAGTEQINVPPSTSSEGVKPGATAPVVGGTEAKAPERGSPVAISPEQDKLISAVAGGNQGSLYYLHLSIDQHPGIRRHEAHRLVDQMAYGLVGRKAAERELRALFASAGQPSGAPAGNEAYTGPDATAWERGRYDAYPLPSLTDPLNMFRPPAPYDGAVFEAPKPTAPNGPIPIGSWTVAANSELISPEYAKGLIRWAITSYGQAEEFIGQLSEPSPEKIREIEDIANAIAYAKIQDYDKLRVMASQQYFYYYKDLYRELDSVVFEHKDPKKVLEYLNGVRLDTQSSARRHQASGEYWQNYARTEWAATPGQENSLASLAGEATPDILAALSIPRIAGAIGLALYGALRSGGAGVSKAREAGASEVVQTEAGWWNAGWGALSSLPFAEKVAKIPFVKNALGRTAGTLLTAGMEGVQQATQKTGENLISWWKFDKNQEWLEGTGGAFLGGAISSYFGNVIGQVHASGRNYTALKSISSESSSWRASGQDLEVLRDFVGEKLKGEPAEYLYISPDEFFVGMKEIGAEPREVFRKIKGAPISDFDTAVSTGGDLRIPTASYLVDFAGMKEGEAMLRHLRLDPSDMPWAVAEKYNEEVRKALEEITKEAPQWRAKLDTGTEPVAASTGVPTDKPSPTSANGPSLDTRSTNPPSDSSRQTHEKGKTQQQKRNEARREAEAQQQADGAKIRQNNADKKREASRQHKVAKEERKRAFWKTQKELSEGPAPSTDKDTLMRSISP
ncbi:hypothetical protein KL86PLE_90632 [uncultured Pleomorphomonas sp.]|uniref:Uncharacterized protein n=1 Tax=uncultured Pleomorphomonas sp. TaxID=442121 RepID=A0A212LQF4_9HYPH|nr:hypothetical protein [uncultured Pleomorphomonas sp.]SCM79773.1 hypothetical protein KL86PLE_90632 [uncultured Pleomorphomonas sp.]